ncbi:MAG: hypothetical protein HOC71_07125 [Candidatus Latescibacteria bacterium]|jgi:O-antigen/teichoic acid export membrane protein|nr:hypothetical protein [Candidatus Latescibacterota bacterium]
MTEKQQSSHVGFLRRSVIFLILNLLYSVFELLFNGVSVRLPADGYSTFWALIRIFFIVTTPLISVQLVVSKEIASYGVLGEFGKRRYFIARTFRYTALLALAIILFGLCVSPVIAGFLRIETFTPVILMFLGIGVYSLLPVLFGTIQGLKRFYALGIVQAAWGFLRFSFAFIIVMVVAGGLNMFLAGTILVMAIVAILSFSIIRPVYGHKSVRIGTQEIMRSYRFILPVFVMVLCVMIMKNIDVVFAKRYFDTASASAYTTAALVGSAFFTLSGIFIVMFPLVSEEKTRGGNPIIFIFKSVGFVAVFSIIGIVVAWVRPDVLMYIVTVGKYIPGSEPLIKLISVAIPPLSLVYIMSNYLLAKHQWKFIPLLLGGMILQVLFITFNHETPSNMLVGIIIANSVTFLCILAYVFIEHRNTVKTAP